MARKRRSILTQSSDSAVLRMFSGDEKDWSEKFTTREGQSDNRFANDFSLKLHPTKERRTNGDLAKSRGTGQKKCLASDNLQSSF